MYAIIAKNTQTHTKHEHESTTQMQNINELE